MTTESLSKAFASTRAILGNVSHDQFENETPCKSWTVYDLVNHMIGAPKFASSSIMTGEGDIPERDYASGDFLALYDETARDSIEAFDSPGALEKVIKLPFGEIPASFLLVMVGTDQFIHGWDLARATNQSIDLDQDLASDYLTRAREAVTDQFRGSDGEAPFGPARKAPAGSSTADQLAAFLGRSV